jgi:hypothetical protein
MAYVHPTSSYRVSAPRVHDDPAHRIHISCADHRHRRLHSPGLFLTSTFSPFSSFRSGGGRQLLVTFMCSPAPAPPQSRAVVEGVQVRSLAQMPRQDLAET